MLRDEIYKVEMIKMMDLILKFELNIVCSLSLVLPNKIHLYNIINIEGFHALKKEKKNKS